MIKNKTVSFKPMDNVHNCSAIISHSLFEKKKDLGSFIITCSIRSSNFTRALCDLGVRINLIPIVVYKQMGWGHLN